MMAIILTCKLDLGNTNSDTFYIKFNLCVTRVDVSDIICHWLINIPLIPRIDALFPHHANLPQMRVSLGSACSPDLQQASCLDIVYTRTLPETDSPAHVHLRTIFHLIV